MVILISLVLFPPRWLQERKIEPQQAAQNQSETVQKLSFQLSISEKLPQGKNRLYQGILVTKEGLMGILETELQNNGLADKIDVAKYIIQNESGWDILADNGKSKGLMQFTPDTWKANCSGDIFNPYLQIPCAVKLWKRNEWWRWDAWCLKYGRDNEICKKRFGW